MAELCLHEVSEAEAAHPKYGTDGTKDAQKAFEVWSISAKTGERVRFAYGAYSYTYTDTW